MDSAAWHLQSVDPLAWVYRYTVPPVSVKGRMALLSLGLLSWAIFWIAYRAWLVFHTPNDVLIEKLGLDIPPPPEVTLEGISATEIQITWKQPEHGTSIHKHIIQVNGINAGESKKTETAVSISNLSPATFYGVRVFAVSSGNFQTPSPLIHVRTTQLPPDQAAETTTDNYPVIRAIPPPLAASPCPPTAPAMAREHSGGGLPQNKRAVVGRKYSPATADQSPPGLTDEASRSVPKDELGGTLEQLADTFRKTQQDIEAVDAEFIEEEREYDNILKLLEQKRDVKKQDLKNREESTNETKKKVHKAESDNRSAQNERSKKEKLLHQKENEQKKRKEEIADWEQQAALMVDNLARSKSQKLAVEEDAAHEAEEIRRKICEEQNQVKVLDEDIKEKGSQIKVLEEERKQLSDGTDNDDAQEAERVERERAAHWAERFSVLQSQYASLARELRQSYDIYQEVTNHLQHVENARRASVSGTFAPIGPLNLDLSRRGPGSRRGTRQRASLNSNMSSPTGSFPPMDTSYPGPATYTSGPNVSPTFGFAPISLPFMAPPEGVITSSDDLEQLTGGAPMSPRADALLPSFLRPSGDDEDEEEEDEPNPNNPGSAPATQFIGPASLPLDHVAAKSPSPGSSESRAASFLTSPHDSLSHLPDASDRRSIHSSKFSLPDPGPPDGSPRETKKFSNLFSFNRQRGKTESDEPPMLGALKSGQSQSFPRKLEDGLDPLARNRRRLSYTGNWAGRMEGLFPRSTTASETSDSASARLPPRNRAFNLFSSGRLNAVNFANFGKSAGQGGFDPFSPQSNSLEPSLFGSIRGGTSSPRPSSTYSFDNMPHPSEDPSFHHGWGDKPRIGASPLVPNWGDVSRNWPSRSQSRRPSIQAGSTSNLSFGATHADTEPDFPDLPHESLAPKQPPIGTRPASSHRPVTPKLNPAAPSYEPKTPAPVFKSLFGKKSEKSKDKDKSKGKENESSKDRESDLAAEDASPPDSRDSRMSKDSRSILTTASVEDSHESLERTSSTTPSEGVPAKESFIQMITRKSSSGKFNSWKDRGSGLFSRKGDPSVPGEIEEDVPSEVQLGRSVDSVSTTPSGDRDRPSRGWNFMKKAKRHDMTASESSERASETGDEIDEDN